jgi:hypothetical protein
MLQAVELVPIVGDRIDMGAIRPEQLATKLEVVGRVREYEVDAPRGQRAHGRDAIGHDDLVERELVRQCRCRSRTLPCDRINCPQVPSPSRPKKPKHP